MNIVDKVVGWFNPRAGLLRHHHRTQLERAYEAASPRDGWRPRRAGASANADHMADAATIRAKARALVQNVPYIEAGLEALVSATVGTGVKMRATGKDAERINVTLAEWSKVCDADGRFDLDGMIAAADRAMEQDGEVMIRLRPRRPVDNLPVPLQLQLLEIDWLDDSRIGRIGGFDVVNGIAYDALGAVAGYWLWDQHPGDVSLRRGMRTQSTFVAADRIIHLYAPKRPSQGRGFSRLAPVISWARDLQTYIDAEAARKNLEARLSVLASPDPTVLANPAADGMPVSQSTMQTTGNLGELASGQITAVPAGTTITTVEPKPAGGYDTHVKLHLHLIAAGMGVTYEMLTGDVKEVNFSSARVRLLDFRRSVDQMRWLTLVPRLLNPIYRAFIDAGELAGKFARDYAVDYSWPKWDYVNPEQDVKADQLEMALGLASPSEKLRMRGYEPEQVFAEIKADLDRFKALGIDEWLLFKEKGKLPGDADAAAEATSKAAEKADERAAARHADLLEQRRIDEKRRIEDARQHREALVAIASQQHVVNVAPPEVSVAAPVVNVAPAEVRIEPVTVNVERGAEQIIAPRNVEKHVERDENGAISKITERVIN